MCRMIATSLRGNTVPWMELHFDQDKSTCSRDIVHCQMAILKCLKPKWMKLIDPYTDEYIESKCIGRMDIFEKVIYIMDCTCVKYYFKFTYIFFFIDVNFIC